MNRQSKLLRLELKTGLTYLGRAFITMAAMILIAALLLCAFYGYERNHSERITVGIFSEDNSGLFTSMLDFAGSVPALNELAEVEVCSYTQGMDALKKGTYQMLICLPAHFMEDAEHMQDVSMTVYVPKNSLLNSERILSLLHSVESLMVTTESGIMASYKGMEYATFPVTQYQLENDLTNLYIGMFLSRASAFDRILISPYGKVSPVVYYITTVILLVSTIAGLFLFGLFRKQTLQVENLICPNRKDRIRMSLGKWLMLTGLFVIPLWLMTAIAAVIGYAAEVFTVGIGTFAMLLLIAFCMAAFLQAYMSLIGQKSGSELLYVLFVLALFFLSGVLGSAYFLPAGLRQVSSYLPIALWHGGIVESVSDGISAVPILGTLGYTIVGLVLLLIADRRKHG